MEIPTNGQRAPSTWFRGVRDRGWIGVTSMETGHFGPDIDVVGKVVKSHNGL